MSEEQRKKGFISWVLGEEEGEERTAVYSSEEVGLREVQEEAQEPPGFTVERADEIIQNLPSEVPEQSAVRIVRQTLTAAGIDIEDLRKSSSRRESKLDSEIKLCQERIQELKEKTDEHVSRLEQQVRKAREDRDSGVSKEEKRISRARSSIEKVERVRSFFGLSKEEPAPQSQPLQAPEVEHSAPGEETQVMEPVGEEETQQVVRRRGPLSEEDISGEESSESPGKGRRNNRNTRPNR